MKPPAGDVIAVDLNSVGRDRRALLWGLLALLAFLGMIWSLSQVRLAGRSLVEYQTGLQECQRMKTEIAQLSTQPRLASLAVDSPEKTIDRVTQSIFKASIDENALISVVPSEAVRIGSTDYQQRETELEFRKLTLLQLASFYNALQNEEGLYLSDLILSAEDASTSASSRTENWDMRLTLTQLIYSPTSQ